VERADKTKLLNSVFLISLICCVMIRLLPYLALLTENPVLRELILCAAYIVSLLLPAAAGERLIGSEAVSPEKKKLNAPFLWLFIAMGTVTAAAYINYLVILPLETAGIVGNSQYNPSVSSVYDVLLLILSSAIIPPVTEELFFRGFVLKRLLPIGNRKAIIISAAVFSLFHGNLGQLIYTFAAGVIFGYVYIYTGSIIPCILLHGLNNGYSVIITAINSFFSPEAAGLLSISVDSIFIFGGFLSLFILLLKRRKDESFGALAEYRTEGEYKGFPIIAVIYGAFAVFQIVLTNFS